MPKFLVRASYTAEGAKGVLKTGGSSRRKAVEELIAPLGGKLEAFYFAFGKDDAIIVIDLPDNVTALAVAMAVGASGMVSTETTVLIPVEDVDAAVKRGLHYRAPGS